MVKTLQTRLMRCTRLIHCKARITCWYGAQRHTSQVHPVVRLGLESVLDRPQTQDQPSQCLTHAPEPGTLTYGQKGPGALRGASPDGGHSTRQGISWRSDAGHAGWGDRSLGHAVTVTCPGDVSRGLPRGRPHSSTPLIVGITNTLPPVCR
jgi:hypothetical protein